MNERLMELNKYLPERNIDRKRLNMKIDDYLLIQEKKISKEAQQLRVIIEKENDKKNRMFEDFRKRFINNLNDPSFKIDEEVSSTRDIDLFEKSSIKRILNSPSEENTIAYYKDFNHFRENIQDKERDKSNTSIILETEKKKENDIKPELTIKNSPKFQNFSSFIFNNDSSRILNVIKDSSNLNKKPNIYDKLKSNTLGIIILYIILELPIILSKNKKVEGSRGKNHMYNLNLNTNSNESIELYDKI